MDPNTCLLNLRALATEVLSGKKISDIDAIEEMAEMVTNLDDWIVNGGFLPERWNAS
jgi:hypothetical protein